MEAINERIEWLEKAISVLSAWEPKNHDDLINKIVNIGEYRIELDDLKRIKMDNSSLFR